MFVGIDVAKDKLDVAIRPTGTCFSVPYTDEELDNLIQRLDKLSLNMVVVEATGGLERNCVAALHSASLPVVVVNPRQVRDFAKATGRLAKTDRIDADIIAHFGEAVKPEIRTLKSEDQTKLADMLTRRRQLIEMRKSEQQRLCCAPQSLKQRGLPEESGVKLGYDGFFPGTTPP